MDRIQGSNSSIMRVGGGGSSFDRLVGKPGACNSTNAQSSGGSSSTTRVMGPSSFDRMILSARNRAGGMGSGTGRAAASAVASATRETVAVTRRVGAKSDCKMPLEPDGARQSSGRRPMVGHYEVEGMSGEQLAALLEARAEIRAALRAGERAEGEALRRKVRRDARAAEAAMAAAWEQGYSNPLSPPSRRGERAGMGVGNPLGMLGSFKGEEEQRVHSPRASGTQLQPRHAEGAARGTLVAASGAHEGNVSGVEGSGDELLQRHKQHNEQQQQQQQRRQQQQMWQQQQQQEEEKEEEEDRDEHPSQFQHQHQHQQHLQDEGSAPGKKQASIAAAFGLGSVNAAGMKLLGKKASLGDHVLQQPYEDVGKRYVMHRNQLGSGQYGVIRKCMDKETGGVYACKSINKDKIRVSRLAFFQGVSSVLLRRFKGFIRASPSARKRSGQSVWAALLLLVPWCLHAARCLCKGAFQCAKHPEGA